MGENLPLFLTFIYSREIYGQLQKITDKPFLWYDKIVTHTQTEMDKENMKEEKKT